jgi:hypothetical protein
MFVKTREEDNAMVDSKLEKIMEEKAMEEDNAMADSKLETIMEENLNAVLLFGTVGILYPKSSIMCSINSPIV